MIVKTGDPLTEQFITKCVSEKLQDNFRLQRLQDYYDGKQDILLRFYDDTTKPNNKIVVNYCKSIADFMTAYLVGVPIEYKNAPQVIIDNLNYNDDADTTQEVTLNMNIFGYGCELFYTDRDGIARFRSIDPRECIFVMDDTLEELLIAFIRLYPKTDPTEGYNVTVYTANDYTEYSLTQAVNEIKVIGKATPHYFRDVPVILYRNNKDLISTYEGVISLQNALNKLVSDELNDFEQFVDAYLALTGLQGTQPEDLENMKKNRVLLLDGEARAEWVVKNVNNAHIKDLKDALTKQILDMGSIPDMYDMGSFGPSGVALRFKLVPTEIQASKQERILKRGIQRKLELLYNIITMLDSSIGAYTNIDVIFQRNFLMLVDEELQKASLDLQLVSSGLLSKVTYLMEHKNMTESDALAELDKVGSAFDFHDTHMEI